MSIAKEKIVWFEKRIADFFKKGGREHLPWRKKRVLAYEVWVSEIMLQQTQASRVILYYERFLKKFPTIEALSKASWEEFLLYYAGLGYYARGHNMLETAKTVMKEYGGIFPRDRKLLEKLPGIGPYTAAAILSFAYDGDYLAWDTNLRRVMGRFFFGGKHLVSDETFWENKYAMPKKEMNAALMDFGSSLCVARPKCEACSLKTRCVYYREKGKREKMTQKRKKWTLSGNPKDMRAIVYLHECHKKYFSSVRESYKPFFLPVGYATRAGIKEYFKKTYGLDVSVRPPHKRILVNKKSAILIRAQILLGRPCFRVFPREAISKKILEML
ncbi:MAG: A/G-specific adenine glycosylase [Candidatus Moranbacteria bacterium]|nr:A/G-specific adenine glycosylase [Candidatus Moranbacteria bacterium]